MSRLSCLPTSGSLVAALLLVSGVWLAPTTSWASCGHYITSKMHADGAGVIGFERLGSLETRFGTTQNRGLPGLPASPCAGLRCSRDRTFPVPAPRAQPRLNQWGCLHLPAFSLRIPSSLLPFEDDCAPPSDRADRLERPPR